MIIYYYSGTHWDREWYESFQGFRKRLVGVTDDIIHELETNEKYGIFHFDGQTIVLEDYLEIRPEMEPRLRDLIKKGKILIGPWYNMPDEFLVSGESLIKNLRKGKLICESYGVKPTDNAYICDIFGHASQTPQIFAGMGYRNTILGRGTNEHTEPAHFLWEALDGTGICTYKLRDADGYGDFTAFIRKYNIDTMPPAEFDEALKTYIESEMARTDIPLLLLMDALDHMPIRPDTHKYIDAIRRLFPNIEVRHGSIKEFDALQREYTSKMPVRRGELCRPAKEQHSYIHVITNTLSSRYPVKKYNDINQTRLEKWVSPLYALGKTDMAPGFLHLANKYLLQNHPHDSICGCSIDQIYKDMEYRFDQTSMLCDEIIRPFVASLKEDSEGNSREGLCLRIYNPLPYRLKRTIVVRADLQNMTHYSEPFGYEKIPAFRLYDCNEQELEYGYVQSYRDDSYDISFEAELVPCGVTEFYLQPSTKPTRHVSRLLTSPVSATGNFASVTVNPNGTVDLTDLETGEVYRNLLTILDNGEIGDGWYHCAPNLDTTVTPTTADVAVIENSPLRTTFRIIQKMDLPKGVDRSNGTILRSTETVEYRIHHKVTLAKNDRGITVHTLIDNNADDHRMILRLPEVAKGETYEASQAFGYVARTCGDDPSTSDWREYGIVQRNMAGICAKRSCNRGLAFVSAYGLHECGVWENGDMDITMMRCFSKTVQTHGEPGGQLRERLEYLYRIIPYTEKDSFADLQKEQDILAAGFISVTAKGAKPVQRESMLEVAGEDIVYSTAGILPDGGKEVRVFNDGSEHRTAVITLPVGAKQASLIELDGRHISDLPLDDRTVSFELPPFRIATVKFEG